MGHGISIMLSVEEEIDALATAGLLTERQAQAFVYREVELVPRPEAAKAMDIKPSTLDNYVADAKEKVIAAQETAEAVEKIRYQVPDDE
jgi:DNA-directed RNA polymerase specialized sigma24 family protein